MFLNFTFVPSGCSSKRALSKITSFIYSCPWCLWLVIKYMFLKPSSYWIISLLIEPSFKPRNSEVGLCVLWFKAVIFYTFQEEKCQSIKFWIIRCHSFFILMRCEQWDLEWMDLNLISSHLQGLKNQSNMAQTENQSKLVDFKLFFKLFLIWKKILKKYFYYIIFLKKYIKKHHFNTIKKPLSALPNFSWDYEYHLSS
jgi:hypothetical protein